MIYLEHFYFEIQCCKSKVMSQKFPRIFVFFLPFLTIPFLFVFPPVSRISLYLIFREPCQRQLKPTKYEIIS